MKKLTIEPFDATFFNETDGTTYTNVCPRCAGRIAMEYVGDYEIKAGQTTTVTCGTRRCFNDATHRVVISFGYTREVEDFLEHVRKIPALLHEEVERDNPGFDKYDAHLTINGKTIQMPMHSQLWEDIETLLINELEESKQ